MSTTFPIILNYLKTALRRMRSQKLYSIINITGLAVSLTLAILMLSHIHRELSYEKYFPKSERIYRARIDSVYGPNIRNWARSAPALGPELEESVPEIEDTCRLSQLTNDVLAPADIPLHQVEVQNGFLADSSFFSMFDIQINNDKAASAFGEPHRIVLSRRLADKLFPGRNPVGEILSSETYGEKGSWLVCGIMRDLPKESHMSVDYLVSMPTMPILINFPEVFEHRTWKAMYTYILLKPGVSLAQFNEKSPAFMRKFLSKKPGVTERLSLQPIRSIHLHSKLEGELSPNSDIANIYIFSAAVFLLMLISMVNYFNLATAQAFKHTKETGMRKILGASRRQLIGQHLGESILITMISFGASLALLALLIPVYGKLSETTIRFGEIMSLERFGLFLVFSLLIGFLSGLYPALTLSRFRIGDRNANGKRAGDAFSFLRKGLVVFQFTVSIFIIIGMVSVSRQLSFIQNRDLGFSMDSLIAVNINSDGFKSTDSLETLRDEIRNHSGVNGATLASYLPGKPFSIERLIPNRVKDSSTLPMLRFLRVDEQFIRTAGLTLVSGDNFTGRTGQYILNESARDILDLKHPLGVECRSDVHDGVAPIVGVVKDFHFASLHSPIEPLVLEYSPSWASYLLVNVSPKHVPVVLPFLKDKFTEISPGTLFRYQFISQVFDGSYDQEKRFFSLFEIFSLFAIFIACLGLFGLAALASETRVKEIGIRKVLGASSFRLSAMLSSEFLFLVLLANLLAWPAAFFAVGHWLNGFAYRSSMSVFSFLFAAVAAFFLALLTVGLRVTAVSRKNPVESLRCE